VAALLAGCGAASLVVAVWFGRGDADHGPALEQPPPVAAPPPGVPAALFADLPVTRDVLELEAFQPPGVDAGRVGETGVRGRVYESVEWAGPELEGPLRVEYTLDATLTREAHRALRNGRVEMGHIVVMDPNSGRLLAYASTDLEAFPPTRTYPAASLVKIVTAAAALESAPDKAKLPCRYRGSAYRLTPARIDPPRQGHTVSLRRAMASSNNQCFAQLAVHAVGGGPLLAMVERFGWLAAPAPAHAAGRADVGEDRFALGRFGAGLAGAEITPLHAVQLAAALAHGELRAPLWIERVVDGQGRELLLPAVQAPRQAMDPDTAAQLREMLVDTTTRGTARSAFRRRNGRPMVGDVKIAGKTGSLTGRDPAGKYEWFVGVAPADAPALAVATVVVHGDLYWRGGAQLAADMLRRAFCPEGRCRAENAARWLRSSASATAVRSRDEPPES